MESHKIHSIQSDACEKRIVTGCSDGVVRIFDNTAELGQPPSLDLIQELQTQHGVCTKAVFVNDGELIISAYFSGKIAIWKRENGSYSLATTRDVFTGTIYDLDILYTINVIKIYCACSDGVLRVLDLAGGYNFNQNEIVAHRFGITCVYSSKSIVLTGGLDNSVVLWRNENDLKEEIRFRDHKGVVRDVEVCPDNVFGFLCFASCGEDGLVNIYTKVESNYNKQSIDIGEPVYSLSWSRTGFSLSVGYGDNNFKCFIPGSDGEFTEVELSKCGE
ncbi:Protein SEC13 [Nosema bombycis CQ1]|uniref:Protein SEC13 n=1 Tax=Nosema bombycis (strain CQ1 / CVCC 102059) TaxID=578461 RepID=R0KVX2_NOSB1|nr:Protein SEC13 [Nosema bombycis CQ1]|eukprot:EOB15061.1 Protein SEC13 [Nosema bombycis CQ1]